MVDVRCHPHRRAVDDERSVSDEDRCEIGIFEEREVAAAHFEGRTFPLPSDAPRDDAQRVQTDDDGF